jgi:hypothetical protein
VSRRSGVGRAIPPDGARDHHGKQGDAVLEDRLPFPARSLEHDRLTGTWNTRCGCRDGAATPAALGQVPPRRGQIVFLPSPRCECLDGASSQTFHTDIICRRPQQIATICQVRGVISHHRRARERRCRPLVVRRTGSLPRDHGGIPRSQMSLACRDGHPAALHRVRDGLAGKRRIELDRERSCWSRRSRGHWPMHRRSAT